MIARLLQGLSWSHFVQQLRKGLKESKLTQVPQLESSREFHVSHTVFGRAFPYLDKAVEGADPNHNFKPSALRLRLR